jgi:hypothetical protein
MSYLTFDIVVRAEVLHALLFQHIFVNGKLSGERPTLTRQDDVRSVGHNFWFAALRFNVATATRDHFQGSRVDHCEKKLQNDQSCLMSCSNQTTKPRNKVVSHIGNQTEISNINTTPFSQIHLHSNHLRDRWIICPTGVTTTVVSDQNFIVAKLRFDKNKKTNTQNSIGPWMQAHAQYQKPQAMKLHRVD